MENLSHLNKIKPERAFFKDIGTIQETERTELSRPLGALSNAVIDAPALLNVALSKTEPEFMKADAAQQLVSQFDQAAQLVLEEGQDRLLKSPNLEGQIANLDTAIAAKMIRLTGSPLPPSMNRLVRRVPLGIVDEIPYGLLVIANPMEDPRTLTGTNVEKEFYELHQLTEPHAHAVGEFLNKGLDDLQNGYSTESVKHMTEMAVEHMPTVLANMQTLAEQLVLFNDVIRPALATLEGHPFHAASGKDSATMMALSFLTRGEMLPSNMFREIRANAPYYHEPHRNLLKEAYQKAVTGTSLIDMVVQYGFPDELTQLFGYMEQQLTKFRGMHSKAVRRNIPGAFEGKTDGTGGVSKNELADFLNGRIRMHTHSGELVDRLQSSSNPYAELYQLKNEYAQR